MKLKTFLISNKISLTTLAKKLDIKKQTVSSQMKYWENGGQPTLKTIAIWSKVLKISKEEFINLICK